MRDDSEGLWPQGQHRKVRAQEVRNGNAASLSSQADERMCEESGTYPQSFVVSYDDQAGLVMLRLGIPHEGLELP